MFPVEFEYFRAESVGEAISLLGEHPGAAVLAGGHSLIPAMKLRLSNPAALIDLGRIEALKGVTVSDGAVRIGSLTTYATLAASEDLPTGLAEAASLIGDRQVRNRGTIGGNVAHNDPASDLAPVLTALGASFHASGPEGERVVPASEFFTGMFETALEGDEVLAEVELPRKSGAGSAYVKLPHPASGYAMIGVAVVLNVAGGVCTAARVVIGGMTPIATPAPSAEEALVGQALDEDAFAAAAEAAVENLGEDLLGDLHASAIYRKSVLPVYVRKALTLAASRTAQ